MSEKDHIGYPLPFFFASVFGHSRAERSLCVAFQFLMKKRKDKYHKEKTNEPWKAKKSSGTTGISTANLARKTNVGSDKPIEILASTVFSLTLNLQLSDLFVVFKLLWPFNADSIPINFLWLWLLSFWESLTRLSTSGLPLISVHYFNFCDVLQLRLPSFHQLALIISWPKIDRLLTLSCS